MRVWLYVAVCVAVCQLPRHCRSGCLVVWLRRKQGLEAEAQRQKVRLTVESRERAAILETLKSTTDSLNDITHVRSPTPHYRCVTDVLPLCYRSVCLQLLLLLPLLPTIAAFVSPRSKWRR